MGAGPFTSGLSVADFALSRLAGVEPLAQVMGSSVYKVGWQGYPWGSWSWGGALCTELEALTDAWNEARRLALGRLAEHAGRAGADAVVDVTFDTRRHDFLEDEIEVVVNGTAARVAGLEPPGGRRPILTDLSLPDYVLLRKAGYEPVGVVTATSVCYVVPSWRTQQLTTGWQRLQPNQELVDYTQGIYEARELALGRAGDTAWRLGADGVVGTDIRHDVAVREVDQNNRRREDLIVTIHVVGTGIAQRGEHRPLQPQIVVRQGARSA